MRDGDIRGGNAPSRPKRHRHAGPSLGSSTHRDQAGPIRASGDEPRLGISAGGQWIGISTSVKLPGVTAFTAATTSATCG